MTPARRKRLQVVISPARCISRLGLLAFGFRGPVGPEKSLRLKVFDDLCDQWIDITARPGVAELAFYAVLPGVFLPMSGV